MIFSGDLLDMSFKEVVNARVQNLTTAERTIMGVSLSVNHRGVHVFDVEEKIAYWWDGAEWITWGGASNPLPTVGAALENTATVNLTYTSGTGKIKADVRYQHSITADTSGLKLVGDVAAPGNSKYYGTNGSGQRGWYDIVVGGSSYTFRWSLANNSGIVNLSGDEETPGNNKFYGTNAAGTRGWYSIANNGKTFVFPQSVFELNGTVRLVNDAAEPGNSRYYGTNSSGVKGWFALPTGAGLVAFQYSIVNNSGTVNLVNDVNAPGASYYYGTNASGLKGWFQLPVTEAGNSLNVKEIIYIVGQAGAPSAGDTAFELRDCGNNLITARKLVMFREGEFQRQNKHYTYDGDTGEIEVTVELEDEEEIIIQAWPPEIWETCQIGGSSSFWFPYSLPLTFS
jgi:hypothetical protein